MATRKRGKGRKGMNRAKYLSPLFDFSRRENDGGERALKYNVMGEVSSRGTTNTTLHRF